MTSAQLAPAPLAMEPSRTDRLAAMRNNEPPCYCARTLQQVELAWRLVYLRYTQMGLIDANPFGIHAVPSAVGGHALVIWGPEEGNVGYTMSLFHDNPSGLSLDSVYRDKLNELRAQGRNLMEVGMLADRRQRTARGIRALFSMMRWAIHYGLYRNVHDIVIGVHPRHAEFYIQCYGFEQFAEPTTYPMVRNHPVVPLRLPLREALAKSKLPRGLVYACGHPLLEHEFANPFAFGPEQLRHSRLARFLQAEHGIANDPGRIIEP